MTRLAAWGALVSLSAACGRTDETGWHVYALEYGRTERFSRSALVEGEPRSDKQPVAWLVWVAQKGRRTILVDTGFTSKELARRWRVRRFRTAERALADVGIAPDDVTDVVLTHLHWDHAGNVRPFARARIYVQADELAWAERHVSVERPERSGVRLADVETLRSIDREGRLLRVRGDRAIAPGVHVRCGGMHTPGSQWVEIETGRSTGTIVLAGDVAYLYENLERRVATGSNVDPQANRREIGRMLRTASRPELVIPGHDPRVLDRFGRRGERFAEIR